jgi:hypothetical protein
MAGSNAVLWFSSLVALFLGVYYKDTLFSLRTPSIDPALLAMPASFSNCTKGQLYSDPACIQRSHSTSTAHLPEFNVFSFFCSCLNLAKETLVPLSRANTSGSIIKDSISCHKSGETRFLYLLLSLTLQETAPNHSRCLHWLGGDTIWEYIESYQTTPWGNVLDAGTGYHSVSVYFAYAARVILQCSSNGF